MRQLGTSVAATMQGSNGSRTFRVFKVDRSEGHVPRIVSPMDIQFLSEIFPRGRRDNFCDTERQTLISRLELLKPELEGAHKRATVVSQTVARLQTENEKLKESYALLKCNPARGNVDLVKMRKTFDTLKEFFGETTESTPPPKRTRRRLLGPEEEAQAETEMVMAEAPVAYDCLKSLGEMLEQHEIKLLYDQKLADGKYYIDNGGRPEDDAHAYAWGQLGRCIFSDEVT